MTRRAAGLAAALALALACAPGPRPRPPPFPLEPAGPQHDELDVAGVVHVVRPGETLYRIARTYGIDPADLMETNGITDPRTLEVGQELFVPGAQRPLHVPPSPGSTSTASPLIPSPSTSGSTSSAHPESLDSGPASPDLRSGWTESRDAQDERSRGTTSTPTSTATATTSPLIPSPSTSGSTRSAHPERSAEGAESRDAQHERSRGTTAKATPAPIASPAPAPTARATETPGAHAAPRLAWPLRGVLYGRYGVRAGHRHDGIDIAAPEGTVVVAAAAGKVIYAGEQAGYGNILILRHAGGLVTLYAHASKILVRDGEEVARGEPVARVGQTGRTTGPHLHFEVREGTRPRNPLLYLQ